MYLLKTELHGPQGQRVLSSLPCTESELTHWLAASQRKFSGAKLLRLIRNSPTLFLLAASRAAACTNAPIQSMVQLQSRLDHCFGESNPIETSMGHVVEIEEVAPNSLEWTAAQTEAVSRFFRAKNYKQLTKSLSQLVRKLNKTLLPKAERPSKSKVNRLIGSSFVDSFRVERVKATESNWPNDSDSANGHVGSAALLGLLEDRQRRKESFESELLNAKLAAMKQLAYGASHEINNPLANIATRALQCWQTKQIRIAVFSFP